MDDPLWDLPAVKILLRSGLAAAMIKRWAEKPTEPHRKIRSVYFCWLVIFVRSMRYDDSRTVASGNFGLGGQKGSWRAGFRTRRRLYLFILNLYLGKKKRGFFEFIFCTFWLIYTELDRKDCSNYGVKRRCGGRARQILPLKNKYIFSCVLGP